MADLLTRLAEIRERQGLAPMPDPTMIDGPPLTQEESRKIAERFSATKRSGRGDDSQPEWTDGDDEAFDKDLATWDGNNPDPPSPLVPRAPKPEPKPRDDFYIAKTPQTALAPEFVNSLTFNLLVCDKEAAYQGYAVTLSQHEYASIVETVINATKRVLQDRLAEVQTKRWEEMRAGTSGDPDAGQKEKAPVGTPRKRGRPRKTQ